MWQYVPAIILITVCLAFTPALATYAAYDPPCLCYYPSSARAVQVSSASELTAALAEAKPGDNIVIAGGTYPGNFLLANSGTPDEPIVVRAAEGEQVVFTGLFTLAGKYGVLEGCEFHNGRVVVKGDYNRVTRNYFHDFTSTAIYIQEGGSYNRIDHNEIANMNHDPDVLCQGIRVRVNEPADLRTKGNRIDHNYLHDFPDRGGNGHEAIAVANNTHYWPETYIEYNLIENAYADGETISIKSSGNYLIGNTFISSNYVQNRHGRNTLWKNNWFENVDLRIYGAGQQIIGNKLVNGRILLQAGTTTQDDFDARYMAGGGGGQPNQPRTENALVAGNDAGNGITVGHYENLPYPVINNILEGNYRGSVDQPAAVMLARQENTTIRQSTDVPFGTAVKLTKDEVGRFARDPYCKIRAYAEVVIGGSRFAISENRGDITLTLPFGTVQAPLIEVVPPEKMEWSEPLRPNVVVGVVPAAQVPDTAVIEVRDSSGQLVQSTKVNFSMAAPVVELLLAGRKSVSTSNVFLGEVPLEVAVAGDSAAAGALIRSVELVLRRLDIGVGKEPQDQLLYRGESLPQDLVIDTYTLDDGLYRLVGRVESIHGLAAEGMALFAIENWLELNDYLEPPTRGWFGIFDNTKTIARSAGWTYATDDPEAFCGDGNRLQRSDAKATAPEYLIWSAPQLHSFQVTLYAREVEIEKVIELAASQDQSRWEPLSYEKELVATSSAGWHQLVLKGQAGEVYDYFRLTLLGDEDGDGSESAAPVLLQLGQVDLKWRNKAGK